MSVTTSRTVQMHTLLRAGHRASLGLQPKHRHKKPPDVGDNAVCWFWSWLGMQSRERVFGACAQAGLRALSQVAIGWLACAAALAM